MKKKRLGLLGITILCVSLLTLTACRSNKDEDSTAASSSTSASTASQASKESGSESKEAPAQTLTEKEKKELKVIGTKTGAKNEYDVVLSNQTGAALEKMAVKDITVSEFEGNLLEKAAPFENEEQGVLYFTPTSEETTDSSEDPEAWAVVSGYDLSFATKDGQTYILHSFPFEDAKEVTLRIDGNIAYIDYVSTTTGDSISTLEMEKALNE
ncbi:hypothetical protein [Enterococcus sp. BWR-S5]|uniref:hypothetical protein n=1 Tax=Enterococcus sp. BWR-S5 TaxID=2787714 RepID=UPI001923D355|nr:hypothetical protein [Enterococcus sp. BWR-S5]MBL1226858.1 hypothetical protein [Enterococcus sp. BWR-S5]